MRQGSRQQYVVHAVKPKNTLVVTKDDERVREPDEFFVDCDEYVGGVEPSDEWKRNAYWAVGRWMRCFTVAMAFAETIRRLLRRALAVFVLAIFARWFVAVRYQSAFIDIDGDSMVDLPETGIKQMSGHKDDIAELALFLLILIVPHILLVACVMSENGIQTETIVIYLGANVFVFGLTTVILVEEMRARRLQASIMSIAFVDALQVAFCVVALCIYPENDIATGDRSSHEGDIHNVFTDDRAEGGIDGSAAGDAPPDYLTLYPTGGRSVQRTSTAGARGARNPFPHASTTGVRALPPASTNGVRAGQHTSTGARAGPHTSTDARAHNPFPHVPTADARVNQHTSTGARAGDAFSQAHGACPHEVHRVIAVEPLSQFCDETPPPRYSEVSFPY